MKRLVVVAVLSLSVGAFADKTYTLLSAPAQVDRLCFSYDTGGEITGTVWAHTQYSDGTEAPTTFRTKLLPNGAFKTAVANLRPTALAFWKVEENL